MIQEEVKSNDINGKRTGTFQDKNNNSGGKFRLGQQDSNKLVQSRTAENGGATLADQMALKKSQDKKIERGGVNGMESSLFKK